jgi:hypothetical protein
MLLHVHVSSTKIHMLVSTTCNGLVPSHMLPEQEALTTATSNSVAQHKSSYTNHAHNCPAVLGISATRPAVLSTESPAPTCKGGMQVLQHEAIGELLLQWRHASSMQTDCLSRHPSLSCTAGLYPKSDLKRFRTL